jgi:hypothetical protein
MPMRLLGRVERLLEEVVEGTSRRLFRPALQPIELARAAERAMEAGLVVGPNGTEAPNAFAIGLHPDDFARFAGYAGRLADDLERHLAAVARQRGWRAAALWRVTLQPDPAVRPGRISVTAQIAEVQPEPSGSEAAPAPLETMPLRALAAAPEPEPGGWLELADGRRIVLSRAAVSLGRALDNDVVLPDTRVSRYHAQLRRENDRWVLSRS